MTHVWLLYPRAGALVKAPKHPRLQLKLYINLKTHVLG